VNRLTLAPARRAAGRTSARSLLVLRVFGHTWRTERLFDRIASRWRLFGPVMMIAAPDVAARTIDAGDYLRWLTGRTSETFVSSDADLAARLASMQLGFDPDARYRVNAFCCRDNAWQAAVVELIHRADAVVMDVRGAAVTRSVRIRTAAAGATAAVTAPGAGRRRRNRSCHAGGGVRRGSERSLPRRSARTSSYEGRV
jgi:hypothetical protein